MPTASLAPFEKAASCFDCAIVAARDAIVASGWRCNLGPKGDLVEINDMLRLLKSKARAAICLLATSDLAEHRAIAEVCRVRMADAINLHRAASRCIKQGVAPPLPASYSVMKTSSTKPQWAEPWVCNPGWLMAWGMAWSMAWALDGR